MFRICAALLLLLSAFAAWSREGYVRTRDGQVFDGHVRFESNAVVVVNVVKELRVEIALTNLAGVAFSAEVSTTTSDTATRPGVGLPSPWESVDIGSVRHTGNAEFVAGAFRVSGAGTNIIAESDSFHFVFKKITGASELVARVTKVQLTDPWARAGLMMRESLAADSRNVMLSVTAARGGIFQWRERLAEPTSMKIDRGMAAPYWLKLKRDGEVFTALKSPNGRQWFVVDTLTMQATRELHVGMAVVGVRENVLNQSVFEQVEEGSSLRNRWFVPQVELLGGSTQMGYIARMDDTAIHFDGAMPKAPVSTLNVANVRFQPLPSRLAPLLNAGRMGVLLRSGEFIDGECRSIEEGRVIVSSVPLGLCRYEVNSEVIALVLRKRSALVRHAYEVVTSDGSVWQGLEVALDPNGVLIREPSLGSRRIPAHEVVELRWRS